LKLLLVLNPFKGTLSAAEATAAATAGLRQGQPAWRIRSLAAADGGPGSLAALRAARGGRLRQARVPGPTGRPLGAAWLDLGPEALIESAQAIGLERLPRGRQAPMEAHSEGLGHLLLAAARGGKRRVYVGLGGSACTDGGVGAATVLGWRFLDRGGEPIPRGGRGLARLHRVLPPARPALGRMQVRALCDVDNPLCGPQGAAAVFGPQKGARGPQVQRLDLGLRVLARRSRRARLAQRPGAGAAGGLGFGLQAFAGATLLPGAATLLQLADLRRRLADADLVLTGEGRVDAQTLRGKLPAVVAAEAARAGKPCLVVCGRNELATGALKDHGIVQAIEAPGRTKAAAKQALTRALLRWSQGTSV
jgi:glycerate kinase